MKREEKTNRTKKRIVAAALAEFGEKGYDAASINGICGRAGVPKGLIYHNFSGKDELYLLCVKECYAKLIKSMRNSSVIEKNGKEVMRHFLRLRKDFFMENPDHEKLFFNAMLQPPDHLEKEMTLLRKEVDGCFEQCYSSVISSLKLRKEITKEAAVEYIVTACELYNMLFRQRAKQTGNYFDLMKDHEMKIEQVLDIIFYGIAEQSEEKNND